MENRTSGVQSPINNHQSTISASRKHLLQPCHRHFELKLPLGIGIIHAANEDRLADN